MIEYRSIQDDGEAHRSAFWTLYIAVMLIILSFIIGAFVSRLAPESVSSDQGDSLNIPGAIVQTRGELESEDLFVGSETSVNQEQVGAISYVLRNHDLNARIVVSSNHSDKLPDPFSLSLARSVSLYRAFVKRGVEPRTLEIIASPEESEIQADVTFTRSEDEK